MDNLKTLTNEEVIERYKNARSTWLGCCGHTKAERNSRRMDAYYKELVRRELVIPSEYGIFNGVGAS